MTQALIQKILEGKWQCPDTGAMVDVPIKTIEIAKGASTHAKILIDSLGWKAENISLVCDENTYDALGQAIEAQIPQADLIILDDGIKAEDWLIQNLTNQCADQKAVIAIGSGTINDLCKYASYELGIPYAVFGTAASMNGYASANASISIGGHKKTLKAHLPTAIVLDLDILEAAPPRLTQAGIGDSLCRSTCQADWLLSHLLLDTPYRTAPFMLLEPYEHLLLSGKRDLGALATTLILSGIGMYLCGGSYPASQGEHMIAHYMEMMSPEASCNFHGEDIAVTSLHMAALQHNILAQGELQLAPFEPNKDEFIAHFGETLGEECFSEANNKNIPTQELEELNRHLSINWKDIRTQIQDIHVPEATLRQALEKAGAPTTAAQLGWDESLYTNAKKYAKWTRDRFTFLDLEKVT